MIRKKPFPYPPYPNLFRFFRIVVITVFVVILVMVVIAFLALICFVLFVIVFPLMIGRFAGSVGRMSVDSFTPSRRCQDPDDKSLSSCLTIPPLHLTIA
jgi:hypothetical protein